MPAMYAATTEIAAQSEFPTTSPSARTQTTSYASATIPEAKNRTVTSAAILPPQEDQG